jgi:hypothetical protein
MRALRRSKRKPDPVRTLSSAALAALQRTPLPIAVLVEMDLASGQLYLNTASVDLTIGGTIYYGTKGLGKIDSVQDNPAEVKQLSFQLSGVPSTEIALVLTEPVQGKPVRVKVAIFSPDTYQIIETEMRWAGLLDVMAIEDSATTATIQVTAEHLGIDLIRPSGSLYSDAEQQRLHPGDPSLQFMADQVDVRVVWPAAAFFRK